MVRSSENFSTVLIDGRHGEWKEHKLIPDIYSVEFILVDVHVCCGARGSLVVKVLCYKPENRGFETWWAE
jgi:hypothetical protein